MKVGKGIDSGHRDWLGDKIGGSAQGGVSNMSAGRPKDRAMLGETRRACVGVGMGRRPFEILLHWRKPPLLSSSLIVHPPRIPPMVITTYVLTKIAHPPGQCYMLTTVPLALHVLMAAHHPVFPTPAAMLSSIRTAGPLPLTMAQSPHPLALLLQVAPIQPASCPTRTMRSSTPTRSLGQLVILPTA